MSPICGGYALGNVTGQIGAYQASTQQTYNNVQRSLINHCIRFTCNSAGTEELPDDDKHVLKHVGAAEKIKKTAKISAFVGYL
jgi:hypothetical protein